MSAPSTASAEANLVSLVLALLTPMFLWSTAGDIRLAHTAAAETLNTYRIANRLDLWTVAKIIAFDIATLSSLSQSMYEDISISMALRLRGNANSLDRSGERNRRALEQTNRTAEQTEVSVEAAIAEAQRMVQEAKARIQAAASATETKPDPAPAAAPAAPAAQAPAPEPASAPAARTPAEQPHAAWPDAVTAVAEELAADINDVPPGQRWGEMARIMALTAAAADIATAAAPPHVPAMAAE